MSGPIEKEGYLQKYSKGLMGEKWKRCFVTLYRDGSFFWFKKKNDPTSSGNCSLKNVAKYLACGAYARTLPKSPELPIDGKVDWLIAFPEEPKKGSKIQFFMAETDAEFSSWMESINHVLPPPPDAMPVQEPAVKNSIGHSASAPPMPSMPSPHSRQTEPSPLPVSGAIGFDAIAPTTASSVGTGMPPQYFHPEHPQSGGMGAVPPPPPMSGQPRPLQCQPQPTYPQQGYSQQNYVPQPFSQPPTSHYPQQPQGYYPQAQGYYPQQAPGHYPQQAQGYYPQQVQGYHPQQGYQQPPGNYQQGSAGLQNYGYQQRPYFQPQTVTVVKQKKKKSAGTGKMLAGMAGGAAAGYMAGRMMGGPFGYGGGWGGGFGWGSWSSGSWGSWSSCGSFGSFGSFD